jgi:hypothetical protein
MPHSLIYRWGLAAGLVIGGASISLAQNSSPSNLPKPTTVSLNWVVPESHRASTPRWYQSDGTVPALSKGRGKQVEVQPASLISPATRISPSSSPRMPHGFLDPTHPAGPDAEAEPTTSPRQAR